MYKKCKTCDSYVSNVNGAKIFFIMKLITILMFACILQVSANTYAQNVNLNVKNATLKEVFTLLTDQSDYDFVFNTSMLSNKNNITIHTKNEPILSVLNKILDSQNLSYVIKDKAIIVVKKTKINSSIVNDAFPVKGKIVSSENGESLAAINIKSKLKGISTQSDKDGNFSINVESGDVLTFSSIGFETKQITVTSSDFLKVSLAVSTTQLNNVVVIGYGTQKKENLSSSAVSIKTKDLNMVNAVTVDNLLQGRVAGLNVSTYTAQPGGGISINIRGGISPLGGSNPLYVLDGVPLTNNASTDFTPSGGTAMRGFVDRNPLNNINPNDIESITVLKDASATAIYGSAAANGVILITTKKGEEGKVQVSYNASYAVQNMAPYIQLFNATDFMINANKFGAERRLFDNNYAPYYGTVKDNGDNPYVPKFSPQDIANAGKGFDWIDHITRQGIINDHNLSLSGGNKNTKIFTSLNYFDQKGILANSAMKRIVGRVNLNQKIGDNVTFDVALSYSQINNNNVSTGDQSGSQQNSPSLLRSAMAFAPTFTPYNDRGDLNYSYDRRINNPEGYFLMTNTSQNKRLFAAPKLEVKITPELKASLVGGIDQTSTTADFFIPRKAQFDQAPTGNGEVGYQAVNNYSAEGFLNYDKSFSGGKHKISALLGTGYYNTTGNYFGTIAVDFPTDQFGTANLSIASNKLLSQSNSYIFPEVRKLSQFTRLNYTYSNKYIFDITARRDGSSKFGANNLYGVFPGASFAWKINDEAFFDKIKQTVSELKFRTSFGSSGNDNIKGNQSISLYGPGYSTAPWNFLFGNDINTGVVQTQQGNPNIAWETDITFNVGLDFGLFNNRITGSAEYFNRTAKDLLDYGALNSNSAVSRIGVNIGSTRSVGYEFAINTRNIASQNFSWNSNITLGTYKAFWVSRNPDVPLPSYVKAGDPINAIYGWKTNGILRTAQDLQDVKLTQPNALLGNLRYVDVTHDNVLDVKDVVLLGDYNPKGTFGFNNTLKYKNFDLSIFIYGNYGGIGWDGWQQFNRPFDLGSTTPINSSVRTVDVYTSFNTTGKYPSIAPNASDGSNPTGTNDFTMQKVYFARLKNLTLGYNLSDKVLGAKKVLKSAKVFVDFGNLAVVTNYQGIDPEMERNNGPYPIARTITFGFNTKF
jgi:TonB-linked SusC/RagA family outer membrane protein